MRFTQKIRVGLRREVVILLPVAVVLLVLLSTFALFSYRSAISLLIEESHEEAAETATVLAATLSEEGFSPNRDLRPRSSRIVRVALIDDAGQTVFENGPRTGADLLEGIQRTELTGPRTFGPSSPEGWVTAIVPALRNGERHWVRIDIDASLLSRQLASTRILTWVVLSVNAALTIVVLLFLRHLLTPIDRLYERARQLLPESRQVEDELTFLISSFERALETAADRARGAVSDELAALERTLGPNLESGLLLVGLDQEVLALNAAGSAILGVEAPSAPLPLRHLLGDKGNAFSSVIRDGIESERVIQRRETTFDRDSGMLKLGMSVNPLRRDDGTIRAYLVLFADLTETLRREEEEQVATNLEQVGELAAGVAHEMRNSLATFRGYLTLVERSPEDDSITDYLAELRRETDHLHRVLEDFLSFARPESTRLERVDLASIARQVAADPSLEARAPEIETSVAIINGDAQLLERALRNLVHNAVEASTGNDAAERVSIRMETDRQRVRVTIADRGPGLAPEIRDSLFQPFVTNKSSGVGLGLALAHRIVRLHAGRLSLDDRQGGGAIATVDLPLAPSPISDSEGSPRGRSA